MKNDGNVLRQPTRVGQRPRLLFGLTISKSVAFYFGLYGYLREQGFDVSVTSSEGSELDLASKEGASAFAIPIQREISLRHDLVSLWLVWRLIRKIRPDITIFGTPKAGLLGGIAARMAGVPHRIYTLHGLRLETTTGCKRKLLVLAERVACFCADRVHCVSPSLRKRAIELGVVGPDKAEVVGAGTCAGVDTARFNATPEALQQSTVLRRHLGLDAIAPVIGFVGRFTRDKGIADLYDAFVAVRERHPTLRVLLVGDFEAGDPVSEHTRRAIESDPAVVRTGFVRDVAPFYQLMDIFLLPTYREGFGGVSLEAQAAGVPVITTDATGAMDSVLHCKTGLIVPVGNVDALSSAMDILLGDPPLRKQMGEAGYEWVHAVFRREIVWAAYLKAFQSLVSPAEMTATKFERIECETSFRQR
jgi:glycosyltransferase involved in cell wall biosynthesis